MEPPEMSPCRMWSRKEARPLGSAAPASSDPISSTATPPMPVSLHCRDRHATPCPPPLLPSHGLTSLDQVHKKDEKD